MPLGGVSEQPGQDVAQQNQGHLLHVQTEDGVEQLRRPQRVLLARLFQQLLRGRQAATEVLPAWTPGRMLDTSTAKGACLR